MKLKLLPFLILPFLMACKKPFDPEIKRTPKFFIRAEVSQSNSTHKVRIFIDFFNQSSQNGPIDTNQMQLELSDINGKVNLFRSLVLSNYGYGTYTYMYSSYSNFKCIPESQYTLKFKYKNDSFFANAYLPDTIQKIKTTFNFPSAQIIHTYHQIVDENMRDNAYLLLQSSTDTRPVVFENFVYLNDSQSLLPNPEKSGCFSKNIDGMVKATVVKTDKKSAEMLIEYDKNLNNEINPNPFYIPFTPKFNISSDFAYGYFVCLQNWESKPVSYPDPSRTLLTLNVTDVNSNSIDLEKVENLSVQFRSLSFNKKLRNAQINNHQILFTENMALVLNGFDDCTKAKITEGDINITVSFKLNNVSYTTDLIKFSPIKNEGQTIQLIAK